MKENADCRPESHCRNESQKNCTMSKSFHPHPSCFMNRLAMEEMADPLHLDPLPVLENIFGFAGFEELIEMFQQFCTSAMAEKYHWKEGSPGNLLFITEKMETLIEVSYLLCRRWPAKLPKKIKPRGKDADNCPFPTRLGSRERKQPLRVLKVFFKERSLPEWKQSLQTWREAALSNHSVLEDTDPLDIFPFARNMEKLIEASWRIIHYWQKNQQGSGP